jgi:hypothetical protein
MNSARKDTGRVRWVWDSGLILLAIIGSITLFNATLNHDTAWFLYGAERMLDGARLYHDIIEVNPPLAFYLKVPAVIVARLLDIPVIPAFKLFIILLVCSSLFACRLLIDRAFGERSIAFRGTILLLLAYLLFAPRQFGQREHLMVLLGLPYILAAIARARGASFSRGSAIAIGICAGTGLALKPYFLLLWIGIEGYLALATGRRSLLRGENISIIGLLLLYLLIVIIWTPDYFGLARQWAGLYRAYDADPRMIFTSMGLIVWYATLPLALIVRPAAPMRSPFYLLFIAGTAFTMAAVVQFKGWGYQFYPAMVFNLLFIVVALWLLAERFMARRSGPRITRHTALIWLVISSIACIKLYQGMKGGQDDRLALLPVVQQHAGGQYIMVLSTDVGRAFPLVNYSGSRWGSRYNSLWLLPGLYADATTDSSGIVRYRDRAAMTAMEQQFSDAIIADLATHPPTLLIVDRNRDMQGFRGRRFDFIDYFSNDARFRQMLRGYDSVAMIDSQLVLKYRSPAAASR